MKTKASFVITLIVFIFNIQSQELSDINISPPSPEASSLSKFVEVPVSYYTGLPSISVPFHKIDLDGLQIPINLSYHARGIRVEEIAPRVGIGWALNYGGLISRQSRGKLDDELNSEAKGYLTQNYYEAFETDEKTRIKVFNDDINRIADLVPDKFIFNFLGYSGKFIFDQKTKLPLLQNYRDIKIEPIYDMPSNNVKIKAWIITNENGFKFYFGKYISSQIISNEDVTEQSYAYTTNGLLDLGRPSNNNYYNSWQLVAIESPRGNKVEFIYELEITEFYKRSYDKKEDISTLSSYFSRIKSKEYKIKEIIFNKGSIMFKKHNIEREDVEDGYGLKQIEVKDSNASTIVKYNFNYSYSNDVNPNDINPFLLTFDPKAKKRMFLDDIEKEYPDGSKEPYYNFEYLDKDDLPNRFSNSQDVWGYYNGKSNGDYLTFFDYSNVIVDRTVDTVKSQIGILKKIILPTGGNTEYKYEANKAKVPSYFKDLYFDGINPTYKKNAGLLKSRDSYVGSRRYEAPFTIENDVFGYLRTVVQFMGDYGTCSTIKPLDDCLYRVTIQGVSAYYNIQIYIGENNNIIAPPPGDYKIVVEQLSGVDNPDDFLNSFAIALIWKESLDDTNIIYSGGNRITKTILNSIDNGTIEKSYEYKTNLGKSSGLLYALPSYYFKQRTVLGVPIIDKYGARPGSPLTYEQGNHLGYSHVTEYINGNIIGDGGINEYSYTSIPDMGRFYEFPYTIPMDNEWMRGKLINFKAFKKTTNGYQLIKQVENTYKYANTNIFVSITNPPLPAALNMFYKKDKLQFHIPLIIFAPDNNSNPVNWDHNDYKIYNLTGGTQHLYSNKVTTYYNGLPLITETKYSYNYNTHYQLAKSLTKTSNSKPIITKTYYPEDITSVSDLGADNLTTTEKAAIDKLKTNELHRVAEPIQTETYIDLNDNGTADVNELITRQRTNYKAWNTNLVLPENIQTQKHKQTVTTVLENRIIYHKYDTHGNPLEISKADGTRIIYVWGYNHSQPIAKIENATYTGISASLQTAINTAITASNADVDTTTENTLITQLEALRNHIDLTNAMVTTYTYDPLIGVTSITDPRGNTTYYEYDTFNRLKHIKDADGNILSENEYNYKP